MAHLRLLAASVLAALALASCGGQSPLKQAPALSNKATLSSPEAYGATGKVLASYVSGLQIGNFVLLYRATHNHHYLDRALNVARAGRKAFGYFAYPMPPGNTAPFGSIYLWQLRKLVPFSAEAARFYADQSKGYFAYVRSHPARGGSARRWPSGLWRDKQQRYAYLWPHSAVTRVEIQRGDCRGAKALRYYWDKTAWRSSLTRSGKPSGDRYWDDDVWAADDEIDAWERCGYYAGLQFAVKDFRWIQTGWQHPWGGVKWVQAPWSHVIASVSTAGAEQIAVRLFLDTHKAWDLKWALGVQAWLDRVMTSPQGLLYEHKVPCGRNLCWTTPGGSGGKSFSDPLLYEAALG